MMSKVRVELDERERPELINGRLFLYFRYLAKIKREQEGR